MIYLFCKNYKAKFSTNLILKKIDKDNFGKKKLMRNTTVFSPIKSTKIILEKFIKKTI
jgi:hypothetical protein